MRNADTQYDAMQAIRRFLRGKLAQLIMLLAVLMLLLLFAPQFFNAHNLTTVARQSAAAGVAAIGMTLVVLTGGIDMSVGSVTALCGVLFANMARGGINPAIALAAALVSGAAIGAFNAFGIMFLGMQPFIMTVASASIAGGIAHLLCGGIPVGISSVGGGIVDFLGIGSAGAVPTVFLLFIVLSAVFQVTLRYRPFGRFLYSVGSSFEGARLAGVRTTRVSMIAYILCGVCAGLVGAIYVCTFKAGYPSMGGSAALDAIAAIVIGGANLAGGKGSVAGTVVGVLLLTIAANILTLLGVSTYVQQVVNGVIIIGAILLGAKGIGNKFKKAWRQL